MALKALLTRISTSMPPKTADAPDVDLGDDDEDLGAVVTSGEDEEG